jgi:hypothetical protein
VETIDQALLGVWVAQKVAFLLHEQERRREPGQWAERASRRDSFRRGHRGHDEFGLHLALVQTPAIDGAQPDDLVAFLPQKVAYTGCALTLRPDEENPCHDLRSEYGAGRDDCHARNGARRLRFAADDYESDIVVGRGVPGPFRKRIIDVADDLFRAAFAVFHD